LATRLFVLWQTDPQLTHSFATARDQARAAGLVCRKPKRGKLQNIRRLQPTHVGKHFRHRMGGDFDGGRLLHTGYTDALAFLAREHMVLTEDAIMATPRLHEWVDAGISATFAQSRKPSRSKTPKASSSQKFCRYAAILGRFSSSESGQFPLRRRVRYSSSEIRFLVTSRLAVAGEWGE
jgi:hypothetical protein